MLEFKSFVAPSSPLEVCPANFAELDVLIYSANKLAKTRLLTLSAVSDGLRSAALWCGGDASRLEGRTWFVHPDLSDAAPYNRKLLFTVAECRFNGGSFWLVRAGRVHMRANRMPPVSYVPDAYASLRPVRFISIA